MLKSVWKNCIWAAGLAMALVAPPVRAQSLLPLPPVSPRAAPPASISAPAPRLTGDVVVRFGPQVTPERRAQIVSTFGCRIAQTDAGLDYVLVRGRGGQVQDLVGVLGRRAEVVHAEPSYWLRALAAEPLFDPYQWNLFARGVTSGRAASNFGIQAAPAWEYSRGAGVTVAVLDTGVAYEDYDEFYQVPGLANTRFGPGYDFVNDDEHPNDDAGHGTHVAGVLAGTLYDGGGSTGVAPEVTVMPIKVIRADGQGSDYDIARGIRWAADHGASVINMSLGGEGAGRILSDACRYAADRDCVLVAAAGNENASEVTYPAYYADVIAVGATGFDGARAPYSNRGRRLQVVAPGGHLGQDKNGDGRPDGIVAQTFDPRVGYDSFDYVFYQGTSFAAPQVAGVLALMRSANPSLVALDLTLILEDTALPLGAPGRNIYYGYGLVDALAAVEASIALQ